MKSTCLHRFDADLNAAKDESSSEVQAKAKLAREKEQLQVDFAELKDKIKVRGEGDRSNLHLHTIQSCTYVYNSGLIKNTLCIVSYFKAGWLNGML